jgi:hypothetical protein
MLGKLHFLRLLFTGVYCLIYHIGYIDYLYPVFGYLYYGYVQRPIMEWVGLYIVVLLPCLYRPRLTDAVGVGVAMIYLLLYVPAIITMGMMWKDPYWSLLAASMLMLFGLLLFMIASSTRQTTIQPLSTTRTLVGPTGHNIIMGLTIIGTLVFIAENHDHMQFVGFSDVYDIRMASRETTGFFSGYLGMWLISISIPYLMALFWLKRSLIWLIYAVAISILIYMGNGAKSAILMPVQTLIIAYLATNKADPIYRLASILALTIGPLILIDDEALRVIKAFVLLRLLSTGGWTMTTYYEYFNYNGFTFFTHISIVGALVGKIYQEELGKIIGMEYADVIDSNFNANFWATDGVAALGLFGIFLISIIVAILLKILKSVSRGLDQQAVSIFLTGFWLTLLNASVFTTLLSGGGIFIILLLASRQRRSTMARSPLIQST